MGRMKIRRRVLGGGRRREELLGKAHCSIVEARQYFLLEWKRESNNASGEEL